MGKEITAFQVKRFRSLIDLKVEFNKELPTIICGENNIGKTNFLRALNVFFNHFYEYEEIYDPKYDIPHHIYEGSRGGRANTELTGFFKDGNVAVTLKITLRIDGNIEYKKNGKKIDVDEAEKFLFDFQYLFVESHNVDQPLLISTVLERDGLLPLDKKRSLQSEPLKVLKNFIELSEKALLSIENDINECFQQMTDFDGVLQNKKIKIEFAEFEKLRDYIKSMASITLLDGNNHGIESKGSGAQRAVFLALMQNISNNSKRNVIWGIDEPEAFLQPRLQKKTAEVFSNIAKEMKQTVIITTHSQYFIDLKKLENTYVFEGSPNPEPIEYKRKKGKKFYEVSTKIVKTSSDSEKANLIKKHLGIENNDGWNIMPFTVVVEGMEDLKYLETLFKLANMPTPNIIWTGGASKMGGHIEYYNLAAEGLSYKPRFLCVFDNDNEGKEQAKKIKKQYKNISVGLLDLLRYDGCSPSLSQNAEWEIEDFLPVNLMFEAINTVVNNEGYKRITSKQMSDRSKAAHKDKQILKYAEECCAQNNSNKKRLVIDDEARKKQICIKFCEIAIDKKIEPEKIHIDFLKKIMSDMALHE